MPVSVFCYLSPVFPQKRVSSVKGVGGEGVDEFPLPLPALVTEQMEMFFLGSRELMGRVGEGVS